MHQHLNYRGPRRRREKERVWESIWRDYSWKLPNMGKEIVNQVQEAQRVWYQINPRKNTPRDIVIKLTKIIDKEKLLKATRTKWKVIYKGTLIRLTADFSAETLQARRDWQDILKVMKRKNLQTRLLYQARISFRFNGEIKTFTDKQKLREFSTTKSTLQPILREIL